MAIIELENMFTKMEWKNVKTSNEKTLGGLNSNSMPLCLVAIYVKIRWADRQIIVKGKIMNFFILSIFKVSHLSLNFYDELEQEPALMQKSQNVGEVSKNWNTQLEPN